QRGEDHSAASPVRRIEGDVLGDLALPTVAVGKQLLLVEVEFLPRLGRELEVRSFDDGVDRAGLLAKSAIDAFDHVDVVARGAARAVVAARPRLYGDGLRRTDRLAQLAGDAALLAIRIAALRARASAAKEGGGLPLFEGRMHGRLRLEEIAKADHERRHELLEEQCAGGLIQFHAAILLATAFCHGMSLSPQSSRPANSRYPRKR